MSFPTNQNTGLWVNSLKLHYPNESQLTTQQFSGLVTPTLILQSLILTIKQYNIPLASGLLGMVQGSRERTRSTHYEISMLTHHVSPHHHPRRHHPQLQHLHLRRPQHLQPAILTLVVRIALVTHIRQCIGSLGLADQLLSCEIVCC
jgi:hypothetical protein